MNLIEAVLGKNYQQRGAEFLDDRFFPGLQYLRPTKTGKYVTLEQCLQNPTVYACVRIRTESVAVLSRQLYRRRKDGGKDPVKSNDPRQLMLQKFPNPEMTRFEFEQIMGMQDLIYGNAFAQIKRDDKFRPVELWPLRSRQMEVGRDKVTHELIYRYDIGNGQKQTMRQWEIHHRRGPSLDGILGLSVFELALNSFSLGMALEEYCCRIFENDASPRGLLVHKAKLDKQTKDIIREEWKKRHGGLVNKGEIGILDMELDYKQIGGNNDVMQFIETMGHQREAICSWFRVPQHMAGVLTRSTNNNIQQQSLEFVRDTLCPELTRIELSMDRDLLTEQEKQDGHFIKHKIEDLLRGDIPERTTQLVQLLLNGLKSVNEVRQELDDNPIDGGDEYWKPLNIGTLGEENPQPQLAPVPVANTNNLLEKEPNQPENTPNQPEIDQKPAKKTKSQKKRGEYAAFKPVLLDACRRSVGRETVAFERALTAAKTSKDIFDWYQDSNKAHAEFAERILTPVLDTVRAVTETLLRSEQNQIINSVIKHDREQSQKNLVDKPELRSMSETLADWREHKAERLTEYLLNELEALSHEER